MDTQEIIIDFETDVISLLKDFGLSEDESQMYLSLLRIGSGKASEISYNSKIDRVRGYKILDSLKNQGFVTSTLSSPTIFSATEPKKILPTIISKRKSEIQRLEKNLEKLSIILEKIKIGQSEANLPKLTVISGRDNIYDQIIKIIDETSEELYVVTTATDLIRMYYTNIPEALKRALKRNVLVKLMTELEITTKLECVSRLGVNYFKIAKLPSQGRLVCNSKQILMSGYTSSSSSHQTGEDSALITNSNEISGNMQSLCKFLWKMGKEIRVDGSISDENTSSNKNQKHTTAIIVDDDPDACDMFSDYLEIKGVEVIGKYKDGNEGFEAYKQFKPDVVFLDIMMPEYDGFYALKKIREFNPDSKIIMVTADLTSETKKKLREMHPTDVIYKPYDVEKILDRLNP